ncbi:NUDIX hydrolase [Microbaculum marinum]|uniref:NUDIX hydrolase n=1 Tax=Microbaculum marinum TaxID=1764581 RepID=A0AAW9RN12_9HYPH
MTDADLPDPRAYPANPLLGVSAAVFRDGRVLVAKRARPPLDGLWSLPGGLVEIGETLGEAAAREVFEETGVKAEIVMPADIVEVIRRDARGVVVRHFVIVSFAARWIDGEARTSDEAADVAWMAPDDLGTLEMTERTPEVVAKAAALVDAEPARSH